MEAVESAVVKIQSTFRGKKIRSRLAGKPTEAATSAAAAATKASSAPAAKGSTEAGEQPAKAKPDDEEGARREQQEKELSGKVADMQVNESAEEAKLANVSN